VTVGECRERRPLEMVSALEHWGESAAICTYEEERGETLLEQERKLSKTGARQGLKVVDV